MPGSMTLRGFCGTTGARAALPTLRGCISGLREVGLTRSVPRRRDSPLAGGEAAGGSGGWGAARGEGGHLVLGWQLGVKASPPPCSPWDPSPG